MRIIKENESDDIEGLLEKYGLQDIPRSLIEIVEYEKGEYILKSEERIDSVFILIAGRGKVSYTTYNGKKILISFCERGGILGESEFLQNKEKSHMYVEAVNRVKCIRLRFEKSGNILRENNTFLLEVGAAVSYKLDKCNKNGAINILCELDEKLCTYILLMNENGYFYEKLTELSELMGTSYRHLLRTLAKLCKEGILEKLGRGYRILDMSKLEEKSGEYYMN